MTQRIWQVTVAFIILSLIFIVIERGFGAARGKPFFRRGYLTDVIWWFVTALFTKTLAKGVIILPAILLIALGILTAEGLKAGDYHGFGPLSRQPTWLQALEIFILADFIGYWTHRLFHGRRWWPFHAVHHSSENLDWLGALRVHPVNDFGNKFAQVVPLILLGLDPSTNVQIAVFLTFYAIFIHADVPWHFGPLRFVIATPAFHRWHHSKEPEAIDKNFAGLLPIWDIIFGTYYLPTDRPPQNFGIHDPMPNNVIGQLVRPFRWGKKH